MSPEAKRKAAFVTNEGLFQFRVMPFGLVQCSGDIRKAYGPCFVWYEMVSMLSLFGRCNFVRRICDGGLGPLRRGTAQPQQLWSTGLQLKAKKCTLMQTEVVFLGHIVGWTGLACDPAKLTAVHNWHAPDKVKGVRQFVGFVGYYRRFAKDFAELAEPLVALTRKGAPFVWTDQQQTAFEALKACLVRAPILGSPMEACLLWEEC